MNDYQLKIITDKLKTEKFNQKDGDKLIVSQIDGETYYAYISSPKKGFGSMFVDKNLSFLFFSSGMNYDKALEEFKKGKRSNN